MHLQDVLRSARVAFDLDVEDKWSAIEVLCACAAAAGQLISVEAASAHELLVERERSLSTAMEKGIAVPHAFVPGLAQTQIVLGRLRNPVSWDALDGVPVQMVALILAPATAPARQEHLQILALVCGMWASDEKRQQLLDVKDEETFRAMIARWDSDHG